MGEDPVAGQAIVRFNIMSRHSPETPKNTPAETSVEGAVIISMLGGPGSGKGTLCQLLSQTFNLVHISIGDVLREEVNRPNSPYAAIIRDNIANGRLGPKKMPPTILAEHLSRSVAQGARAFILDGESSRPCERPSKLRADGLALRNTGFPRGKEQCDYFQHLVGPITRLIVLSCPESVMIERLTLTDRNRSDDDLDNIKRRIEVFQNTTSEVIEVFKSRDQAHFINSDQPVDDVKRQVEHVLVDILERCTTDTIAGIDK